MRQTSPKEPLLNQSEPELHLSGAYENPFSKLTAGSRRKAKHIWAVGGGKGGVGKSLISASIAFTLAKLGHKTVAIDLDFGGANLHTSMGIEIPSSTLSDFFSQKTENLYTLSVETPINGLRLISGAQDAISAAQLDLKNKSRLMDAILDLDADYIVIDLGAGTHINTVDFFLLADTGLITVLPEPTSIENAYRFIKACYYLHLYYSPTLKDLRPLIQEVMEQKKSVGMKSPADLYKEADYRSQELAYALKSEIELFKPKLVLNQARTQTDVEVGFSIKTVCKKYFGFELDYAGYLDYDSAVWQAIRRKKPLLSEFPHSRLVSSFERISQYLIRKGEHELSPRIRDKKLEENWAKLL